MTSVVVACQAPSASQTLGPLNWGLDRFVNAGKVVDGISSTLACASSLMHQECWSLSAIIKLCPARTWPASKSLGLRQAVACKLQLEPIGPLAS